jgi:hypothetical protein
MRPATSAEAAMPSKKTSLVLLGAFLVLAWSEPVAARIQCNGNFQITQYGPIATPYCMDRQIAIVAQSYGWKVTPAEISNNPLKKVEICQILGGDIRLKGSCGGYGPENYAPIP